MLKALCISNMRISDKDGHGICLAIENNHTLRQLDMSNNDLGEKCSLALMNSLLVRSKVPCDCTSTWIRQASHPCYP